MSRAAPLPQVQRSDRQESALLDKIFPNSVDGCMVGRYNTVKYIGFWAKSMEYPRRSGVPTDLLTPYRIRPSLRPYVPGVSEPGSEACNLSSFRRDKPCVGGKDSPLH